MRARIRTWIGIMVAVVGLLAPLAEAEAQRGTLLRRVGALIVEEAGRHVVGEWLKGRPSATIQGVRVAHNQWRNYQPGMLIYVDYVVRRRRGSVCNLGIYFYFANGQRLVDYNGVYSAPDQQVAVGWQFVPGYQDTQYTAVELFVPYSELHLARGHHDLRFDVQIQDPYNDQLLGQSTGYAFTVTN